jgi:hypothetical protein
MQFELNLTKSSGGRLAVAFNHTPKAVVQVFSDTRNRQINTRNRQ